jgi:PTH1 family peptidyl-tRNA hydrolase
MKLVVGLGNPGRKYVGTRHNVGFEVLAELTRRHGAAAPRTDFDAQVTEVAIDGERVILAAPQTYMNISGRSVRRVVDFYKLPLEQLLVVCDDLNLPPGRLRLRAAGSAGGQKGLQNIIDQLGTEQFARLRLGIGRPPPPIDAVDYVLMRFPAGEREFLQNAVADAAGAVEAWVRKGVAAAMNEVNGPRSGGESSEPEP